MGAHVKNVGERDKMWCLPRIYRSFASLITEFDNTAARMLDSIYII